MYSYDMPRRVVRLLTDFNEQTDCFIVDVDGYRARSKRPLELNDDISRRAPDRIVITLKFITEGSVNRLEKREINRENRRIQTALVDTRQGGREGREYSPRGSRKSDYEESSSRVINSPMKVDVRENTDPPSPASKDRHGSAAIGWPAAAGIYLFA